MRRYTVGQFTTELSSILLAAYDDIILVSGEVSNFSISSAKHIYFTLKDSSSALKIVYFRQDNSGVSAFIPKNGDMVDVLGNISVYKADGSYQLIAKKVVYQSLGDLYEQYIKLKERLEKAGLFDEKYKKPIKSLPKNIALITSKTGAALTDFITAANRNKAIFDLTLYSVPVQGEDAVKAIVTAIKRADEMAVYDVIVLMRGGGSFDELALFNNEQIAMALVDSKTPTLSAIGHERDVTIADFVADKRAATPTAAANILSEAYLIAYEQMTTINKRLHSLINDRLNSFIFAVDKFELKLSLSSPRAKVNRIDDSLTLTSNKLKSVIDAKLVQLTNRLALLSQRLKVMTVEQKLKDSRLSTDNYIRKMRETLLQNYEEKFRRLQLSNSRLELLNPFNVLKRGYTIIRSEDKFIKSVDDIDVDTILDIRFKDGEVRSKVLNKQKKLEA